MLVTGYRVTGAQNSCEKRRSWEGWREDGDWSPSWGQGFLEVQGLTHLLATGVAAQLSHTVCGPTVCKAALRIRSSENGAHNGNSDYCEDRHTEGLLTWWPKAAQWECSMLVNGKA